jgi:hypothetical protein
MRDAIVRGGRRRDPVLGFNGRMSLHCFVLVFTYRWHGGVINSARYCIIGYILDGLDLSNV